MSTYSLGKQNAKKTVRTEVRSDSTYSSDRSNSSDSSDLSDISYISDSSDCSDSITNSESNDSSDSSVKNGSNDVRDNSESSCSKIYCTRTDNILFLLTRG